MNLLIPLGLIGLIGIPLLILIYIIKPKYTDRTISSTYIWELSRKYRKRRIPFQKIRQSLLMTIQIIIIGIMAILLTQPFFTVSAEVQDEQVFIIDSSASMNATDGSSTRFEKAIETVMELSSSASEDTKMSVIVADENPYFLVERETDPNFIKHELTSINCDYGVADYQASVELANTILDVNPDAVISLYTDHGFKKSGYVNVYNVSSNEWNAAVLNAYVQNIEGYFEFVANLASYNRSSTVTLELELQGAVGNPNVDISGRLVVSKEVSLQRDTPELGIRFRDLEIYTFTSAKFTIKDQQNNEIEDSFEVDNSYHVFGGDEKQFQVQLVGKSKTFMEAAIRALQSCTITVYDTSLTGIKIPSSGSDLYIYDGELVTKDAFPTDGTVWILNPQENKDYVAADFSTGSNIVVADDPATCRSTAIEDSEIGQIMNNVDPSTIEFTRYPSVSITGTYYETIMTTDSGAPIIFAGQKGLTYIVVMALDLHYSTLALTLNMPILVKNMMDYSVHRVVDSYEFNTNDEVRIYTKPNVESVDIIWNNEETRNYTTFPIHISTSNPGVYTIIQHLDDDSRIRTSFFVHIDASESNFAVEGDVLAGDIYVNANPGVQRPDAKKEDKEEDISVYFAAGLLLLLLIEWGVQYREQY